MTINIMSLLWNGLVVADTEYNIKSFQLLWDLHTSIVLSVLHYYEQVIVSRSTVFVA